MSYDETEPWRTDPERWKKPELGRLFDYFNLPTMYWVLDRNNQPVAADIQTWAEFFEHHGRRRVAQTYLWLPWRTHISTVFLGLDHGFGEGSPIVFETMIFGGSETGYQERYTSWVEAEEGHKRAVLRARIAPLIWIRDLLDRRSY